MKTETLKRYAIVLRTTDYKDYDKILTLFSRTDGLILANARGARRMKSDIASASQVMACGDFEFHKKNDRLYLQEAMIKQEFYSIQTNYDKFVVACVILELTEKLLQNAYEYEDLFLTLIYALYVMEKDQISPESALAYFLTRVIMLQGIFPSVGECALCGKEIPLAKQETLFSLDEGGEVCDSCAEHVRTETVSRNLLLNLASLAGVKPKEAHEIELEDGMSREIVSLANQYLDHMLEVRLRSMQLFK